MTTLVVSQEGLRNYILEGVDNLRVRKCRPDRETIAHYVLRKYGGSLNDIFNELENIVDEGLLLKVEYKGSTSYRTPESFDQKNSPLLTKHSKMLNSTRTTRLILTTINDLLVRNPDYCTLGIPLAELKLKLKEEEPVRFADDKVDVAFNREVNIGNVLLGDGGRVYPKDIQPIKQQLTNTNGSETKSTDSTSTNAALGADGVKVPKKRGRKSNAEKAAIAAAAAAASSTDTKVDVKNENGVIKPEAEAQTGNESGGEAKIEEKVAEAVRKTFDGRVSGRNKIKRKVFDPSDLPTPSAAAKAAALGAKKKKRSSSNNESMDACEICNKKSDAKSLIVCSSCGVSYHTGCLGLTKEKVATIVLSDWLCSVCRICNACSTPLKTSNHVECVKCKSGFHTVCVGDEADFICGECVFTKTNKDVKPTSAQSPPQQAPKRKGRPPKNRKVASEPPNVESKSSETTSAAEKAPSPTKDAPTVTVKPSNSATIESKSTSSVKSEEMTSAGSADEELPASSNASCVKQDRMEIENGTGEPSSAYLKEDRKDDLSEDASSDNEGRIDELPSELEGKKCSEWTPEDVELYFNAKGLPEAGALFREQEVDGLSLLLMKRSDVIFGLHLRLGPALKVYKLILQLQNNITTVET